MSLSSLSIVRGVQAAGRASEAPASSASDGTRRSPYGPTASEQSALGAAFFNAVGGATNTTRAIFAAAIDAANDGTRILSQVVQPPVVGGYRSRTYSCGRNEGTVRWDWYRVRGWVDVGARARWDWIDWRVGSTDDLPRSVGSGTCFNFWESLGQADNTATGWENESRRRGAAYANLLLELQSIVKARQAIVAGAGRDVLLQGAANRGEATAAARQAEADREAERARRAARISAGTALSQRLLSSTGRAAGKVRARLESFGPDLRQLWESTATAALTAGADEAEAAAEATQAVAAEAAASGLLDAIFPLAAPDYYPATWADLTTPWQALYLAAIYPDDPATSALPIAEPEFYPRDVLSLPIPWANLFYHLAYDNQEPTT